MSPFIICFRPSKRKSARKADGFFFAWYRDPSNGAKLPSNRIDIDTLNVRLNGGMRVHISSKTQAYAIAQKALDAGLVFDYQPKNKTPLLSDYIQQFWDYDQSPYVKSKMVEGGSITKMQCSKMLGTFNNHVKDYLRPTMRLDEIKVSDVEKLKQRMFEKGLSSSAINKLIECLRTPLNYAFRTELITNPIGQKLKNVKRTDAERGILTTEEAKAVIKHLKDTAKADSYERCFYLFVSVMYYGGLRNNEVSTLRSEDIEIRDEKLSIVHVCRSFNRKDGLKGTKTGKERFTTIPTAIAQELLSYNRRFRTPFIFFSIINTDNPIDDGQVRDSFYLALKSIGIEEKERTARNITLYSLRHGFDSAMVTSGLNETEVRAVIGHSSPRMTQNYYHQSAESLERQAEARSKVLPFVG